MIDEKNLTPKTYTPEEIVKILHSIKSLSVDSGELETVFQDAIVFYNGPCRETISSFEPGSFTRELLELIESHLLK